MKRPTESEIYEQAFEFVSKCESFRRLATYESETVEYIVNPRGMPYSYPDMPDRLTQLDYVTSEAGYQGFGVISFYHARRTFWEWLTRKPSEKAQWIKALDAASALLK